jgi:hypothetical protein
MADVNPLKLEFDSDGTPSGIAEFQSGDTIAGAIVDLSMSELTDVSSTLSPADGDVLVYNGSLWTAASSDGLPSAGVIADSSSLDYIYVDDGGVFKKITLSSLLKTTYGFSSIDADLNQFILRREDGATYENLIRATDGTITIQAEDDVHLKSNTGEDFARFNENAAVWLYYDNSKKFETHDEGVLIRGNLSATGSLSATTPDPYLWFRSAVDGTAAVAQYFGSGTGTLTVNQSGFTGASSTVFTAGYIEIPYDGVYLVDAKISMNVTASPTTASVLIITTTGWGGSETTLSLGTQVLRTNIDPHQVVGDYIGTFTAGTKIAVKITGDGSNTVKPERFASVRVQKIG